MVHSRRDLAIIQEIIILGSYEHSIEQFIKKTEEMEFFRKAEAMPHIEEARKHMDKAMKLIMSYCEPKQFEQVRKMNNSMRVMLVGEYDPRLKRESYMIPEKAYEPILEAAVSGNCKMCSKNGFEMKQCHLRSGLLLAGHNVETRFRCGACQFSGI